MRPFLLVMTGIAAAFFWWAAEAPAQTSMGKTSTRMKQPVPPAVSAQVPDVEQRVERLEYLENTGQSALAKQPVAGVSAPPPPEQPASVPVQGGLSMGPMDFLKKMQEESSEGGAGASGGAEISGEAQEGAAVNSETDASVAPVEAQSVPEDWDIWEAR